MRLGRFALGFPSCSAEAEAVPRACPMLLNVWLLPIERALGAGWLGGLLGGCVAGGCLVAELLNYGTELFACTEVPRRTRLVLCSKAVLL